MELAGKRVLVVGLGRSGTAVAILCAVGVYPRLVLLGIPAFVPAELGGSDAAEELLADDPQLESSVLGVTTGSDEPATEDGVDLHAGDHADATSDGGPSVPGGVEPDLRDAAASKTRSEEARAVSP